MRPGGVRGGRTTMERCVMSSRFEFSRGIKYTRTRSRPAHPTYAQVHGNAVVNGVWEAPWHPAGASVGETALPSAHVDVGPFQFGTRTACRASATDRGRAPSSPVGTHRRA